MVFAFSHPLFLPDPVPTPLEVALARMDKEKASLINWIESTRPVNTSRSYATYGKQFLLYAMLRDMDIVSPVTLASFMRHGLLVRGLSRSTLVSTIPSAVAHIFRYMEAKPSRDPLVVEMKKAIVRQTKASVPKLPLKVDQLRLMADKVGPCLLEVRDFFLVLLMMVAMLRESEAAALREKDVWLDSSTGSHCLFVFVEKSKTDQARNGHTIVVGTAPMPMICPVFWYVCYIKVRGVSPAFFYNLNSPEYALATTTPNFVLKRLLVSIGVDPEPYGSHSCRRGGVTAAVAAGVEILLVARHGNWRSDAVFLYVSDSLERKLSVSRAILS